MLIRRNKKIFPDLIFSKFFLVFCLFLFLFILGGLAKGSVRNYRIDSDIVLLQDEIAHLNKQNRDFEELVKYLKTDTFIEQEAKLKLGLKKENENLVIIPNSEILASEENKVVEENKSNPEKWWAYFFN
ncbi:MAG: septum formation initiator family protein [Candidatus Parcubacteria bacterium]|nr:septum formation initiator family protein [Candidatus Parcubacteria bacterium]